jgi:hypothetical protein
MPGGRSGSGPSSAKAGMRGYAFSACRTSNWKSWLSGTRAYVGHATNHAAAAGVVAVVVPRVRDVRTVEDVERLVRRVWQPVHPQQ